VMDDLLAGCFFGGDDLGEEAAYLGERWQELQLVHEAGRRFWFEERSDAVCYVVEGVGFEGQLHAAEAAELVHEDLCAGVAFYVFEQESRTSCFWSAFAEFGGSVGDLGHFKIRGDFDSDALELAGFFEGLDPVAQIGVGQFGLLRVGTPTRT